MSERCRVDPRCVKWEQPPAPCVPCLNLDTDDEGNPLDPQATQLWELAWTEAVAYVYRKTCNRWPGRCFTEEVRPCVNRCGHFGDCRCGQFSYLNMDGAFCLPFIGIKEIRIGATPCLPDGALWTPGTGEIRVEWMGDCPLLVIQDPDGCCGSWPVQDLCKPNGAPCTWSIVAKTGCEPPPDVLTATGALAAAIATECHTRACSLPAGTTSVVRRGVTIAIDPETTVTGSSIHGKMLEELLEDYKCEPVEQFGDLGWLGGDVRFHTVTGPTLDEDCEELVPC